MTEQDLTGPTLPVQRAFVVQFRAEADVERGPFVGRVEHVVSGEAARFSSSEELLAFMARVLAEIPGRKTIEHRGGKEHDVRSRWSDYR